MTASLLPSSSSLILRPLKPSKSILHRNAILPLALLLACSNSSSMDRQERSRSPRKTKKRSSYGTSRRSIIKKSFSQEQVTFLAPLSSDPTVAGIASASAL